MAGQGRREAESASENMEEDREELRLTGELMENRAVMSQQDREGDVIEACKRGDRAAFHELFQLYKDRVYSIAYHYSGNDAAARDITQNVFLKLFTRIEQFRGQSEFGTWLHRVVANACMDEHRSRKRFVPFGDSIEVTTMVTKGSQEGRYHRKQVEASVQAAIAALKPKLRLPIVLKYVEEMSYEEIAEALGCSMGTVASRLNRGHKTLARKLAHLRGELAAGE